jgi:hypothetical protein
MAYDIFTIVLLSLSELILGIEGMRSHHILKLADFTSSIVKE